VLALNKSDTLDEELIAALSDELEAEAGVRPLPLSGVTGAGVEAVLDALLLHIDGQAAADQDADTPGGETWSPL
jgi:GTP-binding protein